jgi:hypothetical protein
MRQAIAGGSFEAFYRRSYQQQGVSPPEQSHV